MNQIKLKWKNLVKWILPLLGIGKSATAMAFIFTDLLRVERLTVT